MLKKRKLKYGNKKRSQGTCFKPEFILYAFFFFLFFYLVVGLSKVMIKENQKYETLLLSLTKQEVEGPSAPRGRILDRNGNILVDNELSSSIYYEKSKELSIQDEINLAYKLSEHIDLPYQKLYEVNLKEFFIREYPSVANSKITNAEWDDLKNRKITSSDIEKWKIERITEEDLSSYGEKEKRAAYLYYLMNKGYSYQDKMIKKDGLEEEVAYLSEHLEEYPGFFIKESWERIYPYGETFKTILGTVSGEGGIPYEEKEYYQNLGYSMEDRVGTSYLEKQYEFLLRGEKAVYMLTSSHNKELVKEEVRGHDLVLTIDINLQQEVDHILEEELRRAKTEANTEYFNRSFVVIQEPNTGEVLAMSGKQIVAVDDNYEVRDFTPGVLTSPMTPGSVVKGASMLVGYNTGSVKMGEVMMDECIKIAGTPKKCSHATLGRINDLQALALSSNVYQFKIAMRVAGANYVYGAPLKINENAFDIYRTTFQEFGLGGKTGIDLPVESLGLIGTKTDAGLLLDLAMGQYDTYTPIQLSQYITTIASNGTRYAPHLLKKVIDSKTEEVEEIKPTVLNQVNTKEEYLKRVQLGFREVMTTGLGKGVMGNSPNPAGKTGTSESFLDTDGDGVIDSESVSNAFVGYAPFENPKMTITVTSPDVEKPSQYSYHSLVNRRIAKRVSSKFFEMFP